MGGESDKPLVSSLTETKDKVTGVISQWWTLTTSDRKPKADPKRLVTVDQLPLYPDEGPARQYQLVPEEPLPLQREFATVRAAVANEYERLVSRFAFVDSAVNRTTAAANEVNRYVNEEWTVLPKAAAITVGGMAGFVLGLRRGAFGRLLTTSLGLTTMAAFCYPHETVDVVRTGVAHSQQAWEEFQQSPEPAQKKKVDLSPPK